ncbi:MULTISPECIES: hypothetical protein [Flavobacterium]|uniref:hypothetical protein n=1 Tax=Flavobacterium TaxID=237 RepID=UPI001FCC8D5A|nr:MULTISPECIES: hypothetical protein [Flavobacterium]UOK43738.1 hypothetical protein LZF87_06355 [Flavobacterium enshiense]
MKFFLRMLSVPLSGIYLFVSVAACSPTDIGKENEKLNDEAKLNAKKAVGLFRDLGSSTKRGVVLGTNGLSQELVDEYLVAAGFEPGELSVETATEILQKLGDAQGVDFENQIYALNLSAYTKEKLIEIKETGFIEDLHIQTEFKELSDSEKVVLLNSNNLVDEFNRAAQNGYIDVPCPGEACTFSLVLLGAGIGAAICGPACCVFGGVIGLIVGTSIKD